jgi:predicted TIM-barrel fold metal-dependent hydrolase
MIVDTNLSLSRWPFRRLALDETPRLVERLRAAGVAQAWAGSFDALLHEDVAGVNLRLVEECTRHGTGLLVPFGCVNVTLPDWEEDLRRCHEAHGMRGIRVHPNYHGYTLDDARLGKLLDAAGERGLVVQIALRMEDARTQHPLVRVPVVDTKPLPALLAARPGLRVELLNALGDVRGPALEALANVPNVYVEIATLEGIGGVERLLKVFPFERVLFGSHAPFFVFESALRKLDESEPGAAVRDAILHGNARRFIGS